jgi:hypothetical protein
MSNLNLFNELQLLHHYDGGHGWIQIEKSFFNKIADINKISSYSYQDNENYYLEEDCDAGVLIDALKSKKIKYYILEIDNGRCSKIRDCERIEVLTDCGFNSLLSKTAAENLKTAILNEAEDRGFNKDYLNKKLEVIIS